MPNKKSKTLLSDCQPVSIIICAKNEAQNITKYLPKVLNQNYKDDAGNPCFEVIVINDNSTDETENILNDFKQKYIQLSVLNNTNDENLIGKKKSLKKGVELAKYDILLFTDADCVPTSDNWIAKMVAPLVNEIEIVAGYSGFYKHKGILNKFLRMETLHSFLQYSTYILAGIPYMAVGRNLAMKKNIFLTACREPLWDKLPYGDDDILVTISGNKSNTTVVLEQDSFTYSEGKKTLQEYIQQKQRHLSSSKLYKTNIKILLGCYGSFHVGVWLYFIVLIFTGILKTLLIIMALRCIFNWFLWYNTAKKINEKQLVYFFPMFDILWMIYNFAFLPYVFSKNEKNWK